MRDTCLKQNSHFFYFLICESRAIRETFFLFLFARSPFPFLFFRVIPPRNETRVPKKRFSVLPYSSSSSSSLSASISSTRSILRSPKFSSERNPFNFRIFFFVCGGMSRIWTGLSSGGSRSSYVGFALVARKY